MRLVSRGRLLKAQGKGGGRGEIPSNPLTISASDKSIRVNFAKLPPPANVYDADVCSVRREAGYVALYFGQFENAGSTVLRSRLRIKYPADRFLSTFWKNAKDFHEKALETLAKWPADPLLPEPRDISKDDVPKEHSAWANLDYQSRSGVQATFDFYNLPTPGLAQYVQNQGTAGLVLDPVARVTTTLHQMCHLLDGCAALVEEVKRYLPDDEQAPTDDSADDEESK